MNFSGVTIIDISWPISTATTGYKDKNIVNIHDVKHFVADGARETTITLSSHTGTHVDAPSHFLRDGKTIDEIALERLHGHAKVLDLITVSGAITSDHLKVFAIEAGDIILLRTANSLREPTEKFDPHFIYLSAEGAAYLAQRKVRAVGIDYLGIERNQPDHATHTTLMQADVVVIEGLRLGHVQEGVYNFICLPLKMIGTEGAPARAVLMVSL